MSGKQIIKRNHKDYLNLRRSEAQNHARTQQSLYKAKRIKKPKRNPIGIFLSLDVFVWGFHYVKSRFGKKHPFLDYTHSATGGVFEMYSEQSGNKNKIRIVAAADWATYTEESCRIGELMKKESGDYTIHLGDTYYVGAPAEIQSNFIGEDAPWPKGNSGTLALPGNHEFYSNGDAYFKRLLKTMFVRTKTGMVAQEASFFCLENDYWRIIGLDTGYYSVGRLIIEWIIRPDAHLDHALVDWLKNQVKLADDNRGLIIFSHHQYCSAFEDQYPKPAEVLKELIGADREVIWIWGHEHRFAVYGKYQSKNGIRAFGRCIGHGGMPPEIGKIKSGKEVYKEPEPERARESHLVFYDQRKKDIIGKTIIGHNGYIVMDMDEDKLSIEYKDEKNWLFKEEWQVDLQTMKIAGKAWNNPAVDLKLVAGSFNDAVK